VDLLFRILEIYNDFFGEKLVVIEPLAFCFDQHSRDEVCTRERVLAGGILPRNSARGREFQSVVEDRHRLVIGPAGNVTMELDLGYR